MSDPRRLKDERAGELHGILVRSAERDVPSARAEHSTLAALGLGATALGVPTGVAAAGATAKAGAAVGAVAVMKWVGVGLGAGLLTAGTIYEAPKVLHRPAMHFAQPGPDAPHAAPPTERFDPASVSVGAAPSAGLVVPTPEPHSSNAEGAGSRAEDAHPLRAVGVRDPRAAPGSTDTFQGDPAPAKGEGPLASPKDALDLDQEVAALDAARQLAVRDPARALKALDDYQRRFPRGNLAPEAAVSRDLGALESAGQHDTAEGMARDFLAHNPDSPHAKEIWTMFGWTVAPSEFWFVWIVINPPQLATFMVRRLTRSQNRIDFVREVRK